MDSADQKKKILLYGIIATVAVFVVVLIFLIVLMVQESKRTKIVFENKTYRTRIVDMTAENGKVYKQKNITYDNKEVPILLETPDGKEYFCIETLALMFGYKYNRGAYGELDENTNKCYIDNGGEYVTFSTETDVVSKNIKVKDTYEEELAGKKMDSSVTGRTPETEEEELFVFEKPVIKFVDNKLYATLDAVTNGFNMNVVADGSQLRVYTLSNLVDTYNQFLNSKGYTLTKNFRNQRALYNGLAVAGKDGKYGVIQLDPNGGYSEVISVKYDTVEYVQSIGEFIISSNFMYGMIAPGSEQPTISLKYDSIELLDAEKKLYIVGIDKKYGVVNAKGETIVPNEYDQIGFKDISAYRGQNITNRHLIADDRIPVKKNNLYGLFNTEGFNIARTNYTSIGCENPAELIENPSAMPTLIVPLSDEVDCIVYSRKNNMGGNSYGMMTTDGKIVLEAYYTAIYYMSMNGKITYYFNKLDNNELWTLEELIARNEKLKELIENKDAQKKSQEELENDTEKEKQDMENLNSGDADKIRERAGEELADALSNISEQYYGDAKLQENGAVLADYITEGNLALFMTNYTIISVTRDGMIRVVFEDGNYKYEALVTDMAEVAEINIIE